MKKLITAAVASAFAFLAIGAVNAVDLPSGTSVESYTGALLTDKDDAGTGSDSTYWFLQGDDQAELLVTNYVGEAPSPRPEQFTGDNNNYLKIDTTGRLYRSIGVNDQTTTFGNTVDIGDGIYLDTLVQFTAADDQFKADAIATGDKIAISYVERDADSVDEGEDPYTNFVIRAAYVDAANSTIVATNYFLTFPGQPANEVQFDKTAWHRLTVRAISNVGNAYAPVGFVVYVDGTNLVYNASVSGGSVVAGDETYVGSLNSVVKTYLYNSETHALLPSLLRYGETGYDTLSAVAFNGNGCVDDISFTATKPGILPAEGMTVTIAWDANVTNCTVVAGETILINETVSGAGSTNLLLAAEITAITVTAGYAEGYEAGAWSASAGTLDNGVWTDLEGGATLTINSMLPLFDVGGVHYGSFAGALSAATGATAESRGTIKLLANYEGDLEVQDGYVLIDLAGRTITGSVDGAIINSGADLEITNSTAEVGHVVTGTAGQAVLLAGGTTVIYGGWYDGEIYDDGADSWTLLGGYFLDPYNAEDVASFAYASQVPDGTSITYYGSYYFQVGLDAPEPPAPTLIPVPPAATTLVYNGSEQTGVAAGDGYTLGGTYAATNAGEYEATATPDAGYAWSDGTTHTINISWSIAADTSATVDVVLTDYEEEYTAQLAFPTASATIGGDAVVGTAAWSPDTITEPAAGATNTYTATFTVTSGNYAGSTGTAEFKVWKAASGGEDWPSTWNGGNQPASMATAFSTWIAAGNDPTAANAEAAFLVGVDVDDYTSDLAAASISIVGGKIVITGNYNLSSVNGALSVKMGDAPNALNTTTSVVADEGAITLAPALGETKKFYQLVIGYPAE